MSAEQRRIVGLSETFYFALWSSPERVYFFYFFQFIGVDRRVLSIPHDDVMSVTDLDCIIKLVKSD